jgi:RHS repeat-associated protein
VKAVHIQELRDRVLAAWQSGGGVDIRWLVSDQLGTPRMIFDQSGSLANVSRHDYLPFGEELFAGTGGRTTAQDYSASDGVRHKFTLKERDNETGLDYSINRYYSPTQGRFTSADQLFADQHESDPQSWNLYTYVGNNPINFTDPFGLWKKADCNNGGQCWESDRADDTYASLAKLVGANSGMLAQFFSNETITQGHVFDVSGYGAYVRMQVDQLITNTLNDPRSMVIPAGGGIVDVSKVRAGIGFFSRAASAIGRWFGGGAKTAQVVERTIEIVQREGNLVEMVGKSGQGEIRVLTEMTKQGDTLVLKGLHMEGAGRGSMGVRELFQFARQLGREQGVNKVIIEGAERTTGANPGSIPRTVEIKVN